MDGAMDYYKGWSNMGTWYVHEYLGDEFSSYAADGYDMTPEFLSFSFNKMLAENLGGKPTLMKLILKLIPITEIDWSELSDYYKGRWR